MSSISSLLTVICHAADGHTAVEPVWHDHCECPEPDGSGHQKNSSESGIDLSSDHSHCRDSLAMSNLVISVHKNIKPEHDKVFKQNFYQKSISGHMTSSVKYPLLCNIELSSFFTPLRTVILLA
ncbi:MAG: hypothetical protein ACYSSI_04665 [Planctomycetota bacterium]